MLISEIYLCTQGEGVLIGTPSVLVRTSTCNLRCQWGANKCDTPYTSWEPEAEAANKKTPQEVFDEVVQVATKDRKHHITHVIISGGEPMLWSTELADLTFALMVTGFHVTIETNGTKYVEIPTKYEKRDLINNLLLSISPKLKSSTPVGTPHEKSHNKARINETVLTELLKKYPSYLKFVVTGPEDLVEIVKIQDTLKLPNHRVFLMPEGITREDISAHSQKVNELCMERNYRFSPREHINIYGHMRRT